MQSLKAKRGNAATEYIILAAVIVALLGGVTHAAGRHCIKNLAGDVGDCDSLPEVIEQSFQASVEDITFLLNLPF